MFFAFFFFFKYLDYLLLRNERTLTCPRDTLGNEMIQPNAIIQLKLKRFNILITEEIMRESLEQFKKLVDLLSNMKLDSTRRPKILTYFGHANCRRY